MTETYTKLSSNIVFSTLWGLDGDTCKVWVTMMALADANGYVGSTVPGLARIANLPIEKVVDALGIFVSPDKHSRTPDNDGRRIEVVEGGWVLLNHGLYRGKTDLEDRRAADRERKRRQRERDRHAVSGEVTVESSPSRDVTPSHGQSAHTEAEAEADTEAKTTPPNPPRGGKPKPKGPRCTAAELGACKAVLAALDEERVRLQVVSRASTSASAANCKHILKRLRDGVPLETLLLAVKACAWAAESPKHPDEPGWVNAATPFRDDKWARREGLIGEYEKAGGVVPSANSNTQQAGDWKPTKGAM